MKRLITLLVFLSFPFSAFAQTQDAKNTRIPDEESIRRIEKSPNESCKTMASTIRELQKHNRLTSEEMEKAIPLEVGLTCANSLMVEIINERKLFPTKLPTLPPIQKMPTVHKQDEQKTILEKKSELYEGTDPAYAPSGYDVTLVEFFDYNCGYCKKAQSTVADLIASDQKVRIIFKELPILGRPSIELSKVAIAVSIIAPEKYLSFHNALMKGNARSKEAAVAMANGLGVDANTLNKILESKKSEIEAKIKSNQELASSIGIHGTPAFVIGDVLIPGAVELSVLKEKISTERKLKDSGSFRQP